MIIKELIEKIEGEAELDFSFNNNKIEDVKIKFGFYRGIENILIGKDARDALVITPRVCGICNHAHLIAAVRALEDGYVQSGIKVELSQKAKDIREFTLVCELIQNHIKWFYLSIVPQLERLVDERIGDNYGLKAAHLSSTITKALAIFGGQWPHSSYAVPGGVTCDPTYVDVMQAENLLDEFIQFFEQMVIGVPMEKYLNITSVSSLNEIGGDFGRVLQLMGINKMANIGYSHDRFIVFGDSGLFESGKSMVTTVFNVDVAYAEEALQEDTRAKDARYKQKFYEVGPLARAMVSKEAVVKSLHKRYKDSTLTRVFARVHEIAILLNYSKELLQNLNLSEPSCTLSGHVKELSFEGVGTVEAARGSLIHRMKVEKGSIKSYEIITPTQWNLSNGTEYSLGIAQKAMIGLKDIELAEFVFKSFDVCSVCTAK